MASGISFACPSSSMAIVSPCKREPEKETLKFEDSFPASFPFATKRSTFDETEGMTVGSRLGVRSPVTDPREVLSPSNYSLT